MTSAFVISRLIFYLTALFATAFVPAVATNNAPSALIGVSWQWDGYWYFNIITEGYSWHPGMHSNVAFFPLFPMLVRLIADIFSGVNIFTLGVMVNHVIFFFALIAVWFYAEGKAGAQVAGRSVLLLSVFPTAFFFAAAYSEAVFLLMSASCLALLHRRRYLLAASAGLFASLARPGGALLLVPYVIELWRLRGDGVRLRDLAPKLAAAALIPSGVALYALYLGSRFGEPFAFSLAQEAWGREMTFPLLALGRATVALVVPQSHALPFFMNIANVAASIGALALAVVLWRRDASGAAFVALAVLAYLTYPVGPGSAAWDPWQGNSIQSMSRYVATLFPIFVPIARWTASPERLALLCSLFVGLHVVLAALFMRGHYVF
ncbi:MAG: hypothetical protein M3N53_07935 [Actinomycetota bacterium]|nr:hypothetical protein [Actinomycetota bacterium]